ncbi:hypothetical protein [Neorhizobium sp. JUb45]|uniref:hypothetical protein n=1 Tax=unclassified Neorhizobium TaxID=2629175 RepID=UPI0010496132|nr:hypothetical protein [Neorhizobium sp. JUb45]TCR02737.1 hypothetical protein EDF70_103161 [Neorhizobium sp. JUb45]
MTDIDFENSRRPSRTRELLNGTASEHRRTRGSSARNLFCVSSLSLIAIGIFLMIVGAVCQSTSALPEWTGIAPLTAGLVILIFLTGRHS